MLHFGCDNLRMLVVDIIEARFADPPASLVSEPTSLSEPELIWALSEVLRNDEVDGVGELGPDS